jgi:tetratricopeptide (TPR) repeat protein
MSVSELDYQTLFEKAENDELEELAAVFHQLGYLSVNLNRAISYYKRSIDINLHYRPTDHDLLSVSYNNLADLLRKRRDYNEALKYYRRGLNLDLRDPEENQLKIANHYNNIGNVLRDQKYYKEARDQFQHALNIQTKHLSSNDPLLITTYHNLGSIHCLMTKYSLAFDYYAKALEILEANLPLQYSLLPYTYNKIGSIHCLMKNYEAALEWQEKALHIQEKIVSADHPSLAVRHFNMAVALEALHRLEESVHHATRAVEILQQTFEPHQRKKIRHYQLYLDKLRENYNHVSVHHSTH